MKMEPEAIAARSAAAMWENDAASKWMGMRLDDVGPGRAVVSMEVREHHLNGNGTCHGGLMFTLADSAFAFACNSYNQIAVAHSCNITFLRPGQLGDRLIATAAEVNLQGRSGVYDVRITNHDGQTVAEFRGLSRTIRGQHFEEPA